MVTKKCNCGKQTLTFKNLSEEDLVNGWNCNKCDATNIAKATTETEANVAATTTKSAANAKDTWSTASVETKTIEETPTSEPPTKRKRRGRPSKAVDSQ